MHLDLYTSGEVSNLFKDSVGREAKGKLSLAKGCTVALLD